MLRTKITLGTGVATALVGIAIAAPGGVAHPLDGRDAARPTATSKSVWLTGLSARSEALNVHYGWEHKGAFTSARSPHGTRAWRHGARRSIACTDSAHTPEPGLTCSGSAWLSYALDALASA